MSTRLINTRKNYQTYTKTVPGDDGLVIPFENVCTGHVGVVHVICDGVNNINTLPFQEPVYIETAAALNLTSAGLGINGNVLVIRNTAATAKIITYAAGVTRSIPAGLTATMKYLGGWTDLINASGVRFPATQVPSSDPNTFDDYEEGYFTPSFTFGGSNTGMTFSILYGTYTKNGNRIEGEISIILTAKGSSTGTANIENMPFVSSSSSVYRSTPSVYLSNVGNTGTPQTVMLSSSTKIIFASVTTGGINSNLDDTDFADNSIIYISFNYKV